MFVSTGWKWSSWRLFSTNVDILASNFSGWLKVAQIIVILLDVMADGPRG
jgi:hypothetical protein